VQTLTVLGRAVAGQEPARAWSPQESFSLFQDEGIYLLRIPFNRLFIAKTANYGGGTGS
jgi:hypothetical protein